MQAISKEAIAEQAAAFIEQGTGLLGKGDYAGAARAFTRAIYLRPDIAELRYNLAQAYKKAGDLKAAALALQQAIQIRPTFAMAHFELAGLYAKQRQYDLAARHYQKLIELSPDLATAYNNLATVLLEADQPEKAIAYARKALELSPDQPGPYLNLGVALTRCNRLDEALKVLQDAASRFQDNADVLTNLGAVLHKLGRYEDALQAYQKAVSTRPENVIAHFNLGLLLLVTGRFEQGWQEYGWRKRLDEIQKELSRRGLGHPQWQGEDIAGKTILIHHEQGIGDTIQFVRYIPMVKAKGARVLLEAQRPLLGLLKGLDGVDQLVPSGQAHQFQCDIQASVMDLPGIFDTTIHTIPSNVPYIHPDRQAIQAWSQRLPDKRPRVGLVWAGAPRHKDDKNRSIRLDQIADLCRIEGICLVGLQKGPARAQLVNRPDLPIIDVSPQLTDWLQTAAVIANLDLVISVDTAVLHLAGAMARPAWGLISYVPDFRWLLDRDDSPWYPTVRLFRQGQDRDWAPVIARVADELRGLVGR